MIDFNLNDGDALIMSDKDIIVLQIDMLFDTVPSDVLGDISFGTKYDRYLYDLKLSNDLLKNIVLSDLSKLDLRGYEPLVEVTFLEGTERDIVLIKIDLYKNNLQIEKIYKIS